MRKGRTLIINLSFMKYISSIRTTKEVPMLVVAACIGAVVMLAALFLYAGIAGAANPAMGTTTTNQELNVSVSTDAPGDPVWLGTTVLADAEATLGEGDFANIMYVADVSGSMENTDINPIDPAGNDCDGDGTSGTAMDSVCEGLIALNTSLGDADNVNVGLVAFGDGAVTADVDPAAGEQPFTTPPDADENTNGTDDMEEVISSLSTQFGGAGAAGVGQFTNKISDGFAFQTDYNSALSDMNAAFAGQPAGDTNIAFFLSDGEPTSFTTGAGSPLQAAVDAGTTIHTFRIGSDAAGTCDPGQPLREIADQTGGECQEVGDASNLSTVLPVALTNIASLDLEVNGNVVCSEAGPEPVSLSIADCDITSELVVGQNTIEAVATAGDDTVVIADTTLGVIDLALTPATESNDLGGGDDTHTVTATVSGDAGDIAGVLVDFAVTGQNAGAEAGGTCAANADCTTDAAGVVQFTYSVPVDASSLGTDTITGVGTITGAQGEEIQSDPREVEKEWVDETPPTAECVATTNPAGKTNPNAPGNGGQGQNQDGFYQLLGDDLLGISSIVVADDASPFVSDPFANEDKIKLTEASGAEPSDKRPGPGVIVSHVTLNGDATVVVTDGSGNTAEATCLVPEPEM